jgi:hypothetical protein
VNDGIVLGVEVAFRASSSAANHLCGGALCLKGEAKVSRSQCRSPKEKPQVQICVDFGYDPTQYLVLMNLSIQELGQELGLGSITLTTLARENRLRRKHLMAAKKKAKKKKKH